MNALFTSLDYFIRGDRSITVLYKRLVKYINITVTGCWLTVTLVLRHPVSSSMQEDFVEDLGCFKFF